LPSVAPHKQSRLKRSWRQVVGPSKAQKTQIYTPTCLFLPVSAQTYINQFLTATDFGLAHFLSAAFAFWPEWSIPLCFTKKENKYTKARKITFTRASFLDPNTLLFLGKPLP